MVSIVQDIHLSDAAPPAWTPIFRADIKSPVAGTELGKCCVGKTKGLRTRRFFKRTQTDREDIMPRIYQFKIYSH